MLLNLAEVTPHRLLRMGRRDRRDQRFDQFGGEAAHGGLDVVADVAGDLLLSLDELPREPLDLLAAVRQQLLALVGERLELLRALDRLAVLLERYEHQLPLFDHPHENALLADRLLEALEEFLDLTVEVRGDLCLLALEALLLERLGDASPQRRDKVVHLLTQMPPLPRRHREHERAVGIVEVVDVEDVRGRRQRAGLAADQVANPLLAAPPLQTREKDVVTRRAQPDAQPHRGERPLGPELAAFALEFGGGFESQLPRLDRRGQLLRSQGRRRGRRIAHGCALCRGKHDAQNPLVQRDRQPLAVDRTRQFDAAAERAGPALPHADARARKSRGRSPACRSASGAAPRRRCSDPAASRPACPAR